MQPARRRGVTRAVAGCRLRAAGRTRIRVRLRVVPRCQGGGAAARWAYGPLLAAARHEEKGNGSVRRPVPHCGCLSSTQGRPLPRSSLPCRAGRPLRMRSCPARGMRRTLTAHAASELAVIRWRFANCWLPILVAAAAYLSLRLPCRALIRRRHRAAGAPAAPDGAGVTEPSHELERPISAALDQGASDGRPAPRGDRCA